MAYTKGDYKGYENWKTYVIIVTIRAKDEVQARKLVECGFDSTMSFEDKTIHSPEVTKVKVTCDL